MNNLPFRLLRTFCPPHLLEEIEGDLMQRFDRDVKRFGSRKAKLRLVWNTIRFFRPEIVRRNKFNINFQSVDMIKNYVTTALRVFRKQKTYSFINVMGLSVGLASAMLIGIYILDELSYDKNIKDGERIFRLGITEIF